MSNAHEFRGNPWRCWERTSMPCVLNGPDELMARVALRDLKNNLYQTEFRWPALRRLGPNDFGGSYAQVTLRFGACDWSFEQCNDGDRTYVLIRPMDPVAAESVQIRFETLFQRIGAGKLLSREEEVVATLPDHAWRVWSPSPSSHRDGATLLAPLSRPFVAVIEPVDAGYGYRLEQRTVAERLSCGPDAPLSEQERDIVRRIAAARATYYGRFAEVPQELWWMYSAVPYGLGWNTIWAVDQRGPLPVCSRDWCVHGNYGEWVLFNWDSFLLVPAAADYDRDLAHLYMRSQLALQTPEGLVPGVASPLGYSADRGMPPVAAYGAYKAFLRTGDRSFVDDYYEPLVRYHAWWTRNRDGNGDGLLEWGSNPARVAHPQWQAHSYWASRYETGMDNHPMWDDVRYNVLTCTQEQNDIGLSALHALEAKCLAGMARVLGRDDDARRFGEYAAKTTKLIDDILWNDEVGLWLSRDWNGDWCHRAASTCFYPIFLGGEQKHVQRAVSDHLLNPKRFGGEYVLPVCPRDDPAYAEQYYVRGRIWPAQTLLVHNALREARREEDAAWLARGAIRTMRQEWVTEGHLHETYHAETSDGDDTAESDPMYSFGVKFSQAAWMHMHDVLLDGTEASADKSVFGELLDTDGSLKRKIDVVTTLPSLA